MVERWPGAKDGVLYTRVTGIKVQWGADGVTPLAASAINQSCVGRLMCPGKFQLKSSLCE